MASTTTRPVNQSTVGGAPTFYAGVLNGIGAPVTANNIKALELWAGAENTAAKWNPFATTLGSQGSGVPIPGSTQFNSVGVQNYPNESVGVDATVRTLAQPNFTRIRQSLISNAPVSDTTAAINSSDWGSHIGPDTAPIGEVGGSGSAGSDTSSTSADCGTATGVKLPLGITSVTILNGCQLKALKGGILVVAGGLIMVVGVILIVGKSVPKPLAAVAGFVGGRETARVPARNTSGPMPQPDIVEGPVSGSASASGNAARRARAENARGKYGLEDEPF